MRAMMEKNNVNTCPQELEKGQEKCDKIEVKSYEFSILNYYIKTRCAIFNRFFLPNFLSGNYILTQSIF